MITFEHTKRITKLLVDGKHKKSFPLIIGHCLDGITSKEVDKFHKSLRLKDSDIELILYIVFPILLNDFYTVLQKEQKYVFEQIKNSIVVGCRKVFGRDSERFEMCFENGTKIKIDELLFKFSIEKLPDAYLNY
jgi:hypothetical protein